MDRLLSARQIQEARTRGGGEEYLVYGLTLLGEQLLASGEIQRAQEILLPQTGHREGSLALGLLQLLVMRLKERKEGGDRSLLTTPPGDHQEMEEAREMMKRIEWEWNKKRPSMSEEHEEILELLVELGVYPSKHQRPLWYEEDLRARPVWRVDQLGRSGEILLDIQRRWERLRTETEMLVESYPWTGRQFQH